MQISYKYKLYIIHDQQLLLLADGYTVEPVPSLLNSSSVPDMVTYKVVINLKIAHTYFPVFSWTLQVVYAYNANETTHCAAEQPWYEPLCGSFMSISGFRQTRFGRVCTHGLVCTLETLRIAPKGSAQVRAVLMLTVPCSPVFARVFRGAPE